MTLKKFFVYVVIIIALYNVVGIIEENDKAKNPPKKSEPIVYFKDEKAIREVLSKEKSIEQFSLDDTGYIAISRRNIKEDNSGFCEYICLSVNQYIGAPIYVRAVDYYAMLRKEYKELGKARCSPSKQEVRSKL